MLRDLIAMHPVRVKDEKAKSRNIKRSESRRESTDAVVEVHVRFTKQWRISGPTIRRHTKRIAAIVVLVTSTWLIQVQNASIDGEQRTRVPLHCEAFVTEESCTN